MCGACCKLAGIVYGFETKPGTTECIHLTEDNKCGIYDTRPEVCRIKKRQNIEYYKTTANVCNALMDAQKIDSKYRIKI